MVLVTGASGFLGRYLVKNLAVRGQKVRALYFSRKPTEELLSLPGIEWLRCDLLDIFDVEEAMKGIEEIYHCAAIVSFDPAKRNEIIHFNPESTANLVNQALIQGIRKMVYVSSIAALGRNGNAEKEINEEEEWGESRYNSAYGLSKYLAETEVWRGIGEGLNAVIVNPGILLGKCEKNDPPYQLLEVVNNEFPFYTKGVNSWVDVSDVVRALTMLMESSKHTERYILSAGNYGYSEVFTQLAKALNKKPPRYHANKLMTGIAWRWSMVKSRISGTAPILTRETASNSNLVSLYNNIKLQKAFPSFVYTPINQTIEQMSLHYINSTKK